MKRRARLGVPALAAALVLAWTGSARAQRSAGGDTLRLGVLQGEAVRRDPRARQLELLASQSALRERSLDAERLPDLAAHAQAQYQSAVVSIPIQLPGGATFPTPYKDSYDAYLSARQSLYDPTLGARRAVERAQLAESQAGVRATLFSLRQSVNDAYFNVLLLDAQGAELRAGITDLEARLRVASDRVREGTALPSEAGLIEAELLQRRQSLAEVAANEEAARIVLGELTGREVGPDASLSIPELGAEVARVRSSRGGIRVRPEYERFARSRALLDRQRAVAAAQDLPRLSAFGRAGYGRPGLNPLATRFDTYWLAGVQVDWSPWSWGSTGREREVLLLQERVVASEEAAFTEDLRRGVVAVLADADRLEAALRTDDEIIALREGILRETRLRYDEGVVTSAEYVDRETDLLTARIARVTHRVELARARARYLTLLGIEVR